MTARSLSRFSLAITLLAAATGFASAQETTPAPDPSAPPLPVITQALPVAPAPSAQQNAAPVVADEPTETPTPDVTPTPEARSAAPAVVGGTSAGQLERNRSSVAASKATAKHPPISPSTQEEPSDQPMAQGAAAAAAIDAGAGGTPTSGTGAGTTAPASQTNAAPAPESAQPAAQAPPVPSAGQGMNASGWILAAIALAGLIFIVAVMARRRRDESLSILGPGFSSDTRSPLAGRRLS